MGFIVTVLCGILHLAAEMICYFNVCLGIFLFVIYEQNICLEQHVNEENTPKAPELHGIPIVFSFTRQGL